MRIMIITRHGDGYVKLQSGKTTVLVNPTDERSFRGAQLALYTDEDDGTTGMREESQIFVIRHAGEYEAGGVRVEGWQAGGKTIYAVRFDDVGFALFGTARVLPEDNIQERLRDIDVAIVDGRKEAAREIGTLLRQLEPSIIVPLYAKDVKPFLEEFGAEACSAEEKLVFKKNELEEGSMRIRCLV